MTRQFRSEEELQALRAMADAGVGMEDILASLRADGVTTIGSVWAVNKALGIPLNEAKRTVTESETWKDRFPDRELPAAVREEVEALVASGAEVDAVLALLHARDAGPVRATRTIRELMHIPYVEARRTVRGTGLWNERSR